MKNIPFPETVAKDYAADTEARYAQSRGKLPRVGDRKSHFGLAFRQPGGRIIPVYDPYRAAYPEGSEPGFAMIYSTYKHYPNDTCGYEFYCSGFEPLLLDAEQAQ